MIRTFLLGVLLFCVSIGYSQKNVNDFKYVVIPEAYVFLNKNDEYQLNSLSKFLFEKYGFTAFIRGKEFPQELKENGCLALLADVKKQPGLFTTKLVVELKDCNGTVIFTSNEGKSREKDFKKSYQEALRSAFRDVQRLNYRYKEKAQSQQVETSVKDTRMEEIQKPLTTRSQDNTDVAPAVTAPIAKDKVKDVKSLEIEPKETSYIWNNKKFRFKKH